MATIVDDYVIVGASGDNFDCDDIGGWTKGGNAGDPTTQSNKVEGTYSLGLTTSDKDESWWYHDVSSGNRFKITDVDLGLWFYYIKGKGDNYLVQNSTAIVVRLYFGGTSKYADYRLTEKGDLSLDFGWQMLMCSGTELGGGSTGGGHNEGTDWDLDVYRVEFRLNCANKVEASLGLDALFVGTQLEVQSGTSGDPVTISVLEDYTYNSRSGFPIGTVKVTGKLADIRSGLKVSNGGYVAAENMYLLFNQLSNEVKHTVDVVNGVLRIGKIESGNTIDGCQVVKPSGMNADFNVGSNGSLEVYNSKFYRWDLIELDGTVYVKDTDFDSNELVRLYSGTTMLNNTVHDESVLRYDHAVDVVENPSEIDGLTIYRCKDGIMVSETCELTGVRLLDNTQNDMVVMDGKTASLSNSEYTSVVRKV